MAEIPVFLGQMSAHQGNSEAKKLRLSARAATEASHRTATKMGLIHHKCVNHSLGLRAKTHALTRNIC